MTDDAAIRLFVYESAVAGRIPSPVDVGRRFGIPPREAGAAFSRLANDRHALVLLPGSSYIWMAVPFSAVPTDYPVVGDRLTWYGNCIWDALGIASLVGEQCRIPTACPNSGAELEVATEGGRLTESDGVVHFAVPAGRWWDSIGFT